MRAWLYELLTTDAELADQLGGVEAIVDRVIPRRGGENVDLPTPYLVFGLGNATNESLGDSTAGDVEAERQFFEIWVHDSGGSFLTIDDIIILVKKRLTGASNPAANVITIRYLETSGEFSNETYNTIFRYIRFQAIRAKEGTPS